MQTLSVHGLMLYYDEAEGATADLVRQACDRTVPVLKDRWGLPTPADCRVYVMTSWQRFLFHAAPWPRRIAYALFYPIVWLQAARVWPYAGGWNLPLGRRMAVGIKPARLIEHAERGLGRRLFTPAGGAGESVQRITGHELTHAFSTHLRLPAWLREGLAMVAVDRALGQATVRPETLRRLQHPRAPVTRIRLRQPEAVLDLYARGYWLTRYLDEAQPELLRSVLAGPRPRGRLEAAIARQLNLAEGDLWKQAGPLVGAHFALSQGQPSRGG